MDLQGFKKRLKGVRDRFDTMMERIMEEHKVARREKKMNGGGEVKDLLHILLDIDEDKRLEMKLCKQTIKVIIVVRNHYLLFMLQVILIAY